jgi:hypothetical protein
MPAERKAAESEAFLRELLPAEWAKKNADKRSRLGGEGLIERLQPSCSRRERTSVRGPFDAADNWPSQRAVRERGHPILHRFEQCSRDGSKPLIVSLSIRLRAGITKCLPSRV